MSEWQPIETAPKDGTEILVFDNGHIYVASWGVNAFDDPPSWVSNTEPGGMHWSGLVTHWMPLPEPPEVSP